MLPTSSIFSNEATSPDGELDLVIAFDNGTVLNSAEADMIAGSAALSEFAFTDTDVTYGGCLSSEFSVEIPQSVMDDAGNDVSGWAKVYAGNGLAGTDDFDDYSQGAYFHYVTLGTGATQWTLRIDGGTAVEIITVDEPENANNESFAPVHKTALNTILPDGTAITHVQTLPPAWPVAAGSKGNKFYLFSEDYTGSYAVTVMTVTGGSFDANGDYIPPTSAVGNYTYVSDFCAGYFAYTKNGANYLYEVCPLGYFNFDATEAVEGVTTAFVANGVLAQFDVDAADFIATVSDVAAYPRQFGNYLSDVASYLGYPVDSNLKKWLNHIGSVQQKPVFSSGTTLRDILSYIGATAGGNIVASRDGGIGLLRFFEAQKDSLLISTVVPTSATTADVPCTRVVAGSSLRKKYTSQPISGLNVVDEDGAGTLYGTNTDAIYTLNYNPLMAGQDASFYANYLSGLQSLPIYRPHTVSLTEADPSVVAGDMFFVEYDSGAELLFPMMSQTLYFNGRFTADYVSTASVQRDASTEALYAGLEYASQYDVASFAKSSLRYLGEESSDLDNCTNAGFYDYLSTASNTPTVSAGGALIVMYGPSPYIMQYALPRNPSGTSTAYVRQYTSSLVWGPWAELLTTAPAPTWTDITSTALSAADTSKATIANLKLYACGNMRLLQGYITAVNLPTTQTTVAYITTGNRPSGQVAVSCAWDSARYVTWGVVGTGGTIAIRSSTAYTSGNLRMNAMWLV